MRRRALAVVAVLSALLPRSPSAEAAATVWAIDDGEKIRRDATDLPFERGEDNPVWSPGQPIRLFALKNETVAFQVIVEAGDEALEGVTVDLAKLDGPAGWTLANETGAIDPARFVGRPIERFVEHYVDIRRASGSETPGQSLGWTRGAGPKPGAWVGPVPDALIPVEVAPSWDPYPMRIAPRTNGAVWIDVTVPKTQPYGVYSGKVVVADKRGPIAELPIEIDVADATLADLPVRTMLHYGPDELRRRIGDASAETHLFQLFHRHRLAPLHAARARADLDAHLSALDGSLYTREHGYQGPGEGLGDGVLALGVYGTYGEPSQAALANVEAIADELARRGLLATTDTFVYAIDEQCDSPYGKRWKELLAASRDPNAASVRVAWTCSDDPTKQPVDVPIQLDAFDGRLTDGARKLGKEVWVYNGVRPRSGTFLTDADAIDPRVNGWLAAMFDIGRWFYWETTFWYDDNKGGKGPYDPFAVAETFHNTHGEHCEGDGVLVYPGKQVDRFTEHSIGMNGVLASIRLKNWRRGIEDAGYYELAHKEDGMQAEWIANALIPRAWSAADEGAPVSWSTSGKAFFDARKKLLALIRKGADGGRGPGATLRAEIGGGGAWRDEAAVTPRAIRKRWYAAAVGAIAAAIVAVVIFGRRRRPGAR